MVRRPTRRVPSPGARPAVTTRPNGRGTTRRRRHPAGECLVNTGSFAFLHCLDGNDPPSNRDTTEHTADVVFDLETSVRGTDLVTRLSVPRFRGGSALTETVELELTDTVAVDTSRDIA
ncbi:hypothetical protein BRD18_06105 [Halobacteriales archaeon SW_7_71_33]|nr:MAG: hypothetical protein BRD18_06105 [Halobacteriales archaeon SW_7_71_33]